MATLMKRASQERTRQGPDKSRPAPVLSSNTRSLREADDGDFRMAGSADQRAPRVRAVTPVRDSSRMPYGFNSSIIASILSVSPTT